MKRMLDRVLENSDQDNSRMYDLSFSCSSIEFEVTSGKMHHGSFRIIADNKSNPEGYIFTDDMRMVIRTSEFTGLEREIFYEYDSTGLKEGTQASGVINIVSNLGEYEIPYTVKISNVTMGSDLGEVRNLFHFANLAKTDWEQAVRLFYSPNFENILTGNDSVYRGYYRGLSSGLLEDEDGNIIYNENNVDRFLELTKKKTRAKFQLDTSSIDIKNPSGTESRDIVVDRWGWGYTFIELSTDCDFVIFDKDYLTDADFEDGKAVVHIDIDLSQLHRGKNHGVIYISDFYQQEEIPVNISCNASSPAERSGRRSDNMKLMSLYMNYRLGKINKTEWARDCSVTISRMISQDENDLTSRLYQVHLYIMQKRDNDARNILERTKLMLDEKTPTELIGYSLYLEYLMSKDDESKAEYAEAIELLYVQNIHSHRLAWLMAYTNEELRNNDVKFWKHLKEQYENGCNSPLMFIDALNIMVRTPSVMTSLSDFELAFLAFARRHGSITREIRSRLTFLADNEIAYNNEVLDLLIYSYEVDPRDDILSQICTMLMKGNCIGEEFFTWYEKAVEKELRINKLYEYYIMSIDINYAGRLPKIILMYFAYRSNLDYERNAFLYANVLRHKPAYADIYNDYLPAIKEFAVDSLINHRLNEDLAYIYKNVLEDEIYDEEYVADYAELLFVNHIKVKNENIDSIIVINDHLIDEEKYPVYNGEAYVPIVGEKYSILLEDQYANRYVERSLYDMKKVIKNVSNYEKIMKLAGHALYPALYLAEKSEERSSAGKDYEDALLYLTESSLVSEDYQRQIMIKLCQEYFDNDDIAKLDELLLRFDPEELSFNEREICVKIMVARGLYEKALDWVCTYGIEYIDYKILVRLCDRVLVRSDYEYEPAVLKICEYLFKNNKYDETVLNYMILYEQSSTMNLKRLWRATDSFNLDSHGLLEAMMVQILYTGTEIGEEGNIFLEYVANGSVLEIEKLFLEKLAKEYFTKNKSMDEAVFDRVIYLHQLGENLSDYCKISFLKSCDELQKKKKKLSAEQKALIVMFVKEFTSRHMLFPFFLGFKNLWPKLSLYDDRCFIEYKGEENSKVVLHYVVERDGEEDSEYRKEEMNHLIGGIYIKSFILFYGEKIKYYITEEGPRSEKLTEASVLECPDGKLKGDMRYTNINAIAVSLAKGDNTQFCKLSEEYIKKTFLTNKLFAPDRGGE